MINQEIILKDENDSINLAKALVGKLKAGDILAFYGNLGTGKTTICRGIIKSVCGEDTNVISPTFNLLQTYKTDLFEVFHFDLYRLKHPDEIFELGIEEAFNNNLCLIEWPEIIEHLLPKDTIRIKIELKEDNTRTASLG